MRSQLVGLLPEGVKRGLRGLHPNECRLVFDVLPRSAGTNVMVDVGACRGSSLRDFADEGWSVLAFEPDDVNRKSLESEWGAVGNVQIDPRALSSEPASDVPFYRSDVSEGISGLSAFHESHDRAGSVDVTTLTEVLGQEGIDEVDFLKTDTEGFDLPVLQGLDWEKIRPRAVVCEFEDSKTVPLGYNFDDLASFLVDRGYSVFVSEWYPVVEYGSQHTWRSLDEYPCELSDPQAWGNVIAIRDEADARLFSKALASTSMKWRFGDRLYRTLKS